MKMGSTVPPTAMIAVVVSDEVMSSFSKIAW
jgi:hypothetical protein